MQKTEFNGAVVISLDYTKRILDNMLEERGLPFFSLLEPFRDLLSAQ